MLPLAEPFLATHRVYGFEYPTQFEAENLDDSYAEVLSKSLTDAFREASADQSLNVVGHSAGAMLCVSPGVTYPKTLINLVLISGAPDGRWVEHAAAFADSLAFDEVEERERDFSSDPSPENLQRLFVAWWPYYFSPANREIGETFLRTLTFSAESYVRRGQFFIRDFAGRVPPEPASITVIHGSDDQATPPSVFDGHPLRPGPRAKFIVISGAGHFPWVEQPQMTKEVLSRVIGC
jgi:pimeloyl-ACP methyl ester carboxylesterase